MNLTATNQRQVSRLTIYQYPQAAKRSGCLSIDKLGIPYGSRIYKVSAEDREEAARTKSRVLRLGGCMKHSAWGNAGWCNSGAAHLLLKRVIGEFI